MITWWCKVPVSGMNPRPKPELKIEIPLALLLALAPFGYENLDLPHSKAVGLSSWGACFALLVRIAWIAYFTLANGTNLTFKHSSELTWWRRQVIRHDIAGMQGYFRSLEIPVPDPIPPLTVHEGNQAILNSPHTYRGELQIPRSSVADRRAVSHIYSVYVIQKAFPDLTKSKDFWDSLCAGDADSILQLHQTQFFSIELRRYFHASYWNSIEANSSPGALVLWKIREALGARFTDKLASKVFQVAVDSPAEISNPDLNVTFTKAVKIADGIVEAYQQSWPQIQRILSDNPLRVEFRLSNPNR